MKKLFAVLAMAAMTSSAFAQVTLPNSKRGDLPTVPDIIRLERNINVLQVMQIRPVDGTDAGKPGVEPLPAGIVNNGFCIGGPLAGTTGSVVPLTDFPACRFVGGVLCLDPGPNGNFESFLSDCPAGLVPAVQGVKLRKIEPRIPKCPDTYPGVDFTQTGISGIRTFWALKYTPCDTIFRLDVEIGCSGLDALGRNRVQQVRTNRYNFKVFVRPETFRWVVEALHCQPLGLCEIPCITDEALFARLLSQADLIRDQGVAAIGGDQAQLLAFNDTLDRTEALIVRFCLFTFSTWAQDPKTGAITPCAIFEEKGGKGFIPGNKTITQFGFGIVDTLEHPCCCKLIADIYCIKGNFIGRDP